MVRHETKVLVITGGSDLSEQFDISKPHMLLKTISNRMALR